MKKLTPGTYLCYRKVGEDEWRVERQLVSAADVEGKAIAYAYPDRQWAVFEVRQIQIIDVEKTDL